MAEVLLVSKAVAPPWNDSSKNLVRDLSAAMVRHQAVVMTTRAGRSQELGRARLQGIHGRFPGLSGALATQLPVLMRMVLDPSADVFHFFFAPNAKASAAASAVCKARRRPSVQTVCSAPAPDADLRKVMFADRHIVLSEHTRQRFLEAGLTERRMHLIPPCLPTLPIPSQAGRVAARSRHGLPQSAPLLVYPGDLEFSRGADRCIDALATGLLGADPVLALCCREKTPAARSRAALLRTRVDELGLGSRVRFLGEIPDIHAVLGTADAVLLPAETLYAKMDLPLVLLEAMSLAKPVFVLQGTAAAELSSRRAAIAVEGGPEALAVAVEALLSDRAEREALGARARGRVRDEYSPLRMASAYEDVYDELLQ